MSDPGRHEFDTLGSKTVYTGAIIALRVDTVAMPGGQRADREVVEHHGAVAVVALDERDNLVLIHQYRHPLGQPVVGNPRRSARRSGGEPGRGGSARVGRRNRTRRRSMVGAGRCRSLTRVHGRGGSRLPRRGAARGEARRSRTRRSRSRDFAGSARRRRRHGATRRHRQCHSGIGHTRDRHRTCDGKAAAPRRRTVARSSRAHSENASREPEVLARQVDSYLDHLAVERGSARNTLLSYRRDLNRYAEYLNGRGIDDRRGRGGKRRHRIRDTSAAR